jgi:hypothetical protein
MLMVLPLCAAGVASKARSLYRVKHCENTDAETPTTQNQSTGFAGDLVGSGEHLKAVHAEDDAVRGDKLRGGDEAQRERRKGVNGGVQASARGKCVCIKLSVRLFVNKKWHGKNRFEVEFALE